MTYETEQEEELAKALSGMEKSYASLRAQLNMQCAHYQDMALAIINAFELENGKIKLANEDAAQEAYKIANRYYK